MGITIEQTKHVVLPVGEYPAIVADIEEVDGQFGPQLKFTFNLLGEHVGTLLTGWCSKSFNVKSKLYQWTQAMFGGKDIPEEWAFDSDTVLKRKVILAVIKRVGEDKSEYNKIDAVLPLKKKAVAPPPPVPDPADSWGDDDESAT
jgi:hypothetical protein